MKAVHVIILVFALVLGASASPNPRQINRQVLENRLRMVLKPGFRDEFEDNLARFIDTYVRDIIKNGSPELNIPVLDPLAIEHFDININQESLQLQGFVHNVEITGISTFEVGSVTADLTTLRAEINVALDELDLAGEHYNLTGDILNGALEVFGEGRFDAQLFQITLKVALELGVKADDTVEVRTLELDVTLGSGKVNFENLLGGGTLGDIANEFVSSELPDLVEANKAPLLEEAATAILGAANERLVGVTLDELLDLINNPSSN